MAWQTTSAELDDNGHTVNSDASWKPAVIASGPWGNRLSGELTQQLAGGLESGSRMVRASLLKADALMRSLGRPNRDQIVSMRPTDLTTLEAMDLSNGQTLADWIAVGAQRWKQSAGESPTDADVEARVLVPLFQWALARSPTPAERLALREWIGPSLEAEELEDVLWSVLMLPEFHFVR